MLIELQHVASTKHIIFIPNLAMVAVAVHVPYMFVKLINFKCFPVKALIGLILITLLCKV